MDKTETVGSRGYSCVFADRTFALFKYHEEHPEASNRQLGELFGISNQRVGQVIKQHERDRMVIEYFRRYPDASPAEVKAIFHISDQRLRTLRVASRG